MAKYNALQIAKWFIKRGMADDKAGFGELVSNLKLQKLLYYAQGCSLALNDKPLFDDKLYAWDHGPVVPSVYHKYKDYGSCGIEFEEDCDKLDGETVNLLEQVYNVFGQYSAWKLREMTHSETPWKKTEQSAVIPTDLIKDYFKKNYIAE